MAKLIVKNDLDPQKGLVSLFGVINEKMPSKIRQQIFKTSELSVTDFRDLSGLSASQFDNQLKRLMEYRYKNQKPVVKSSFTTLVRKLNAK